MRQTAIAPPQCAQRVRSSIVAALILAASAPLLAQSYSQELDVTVIQVPVVVSREGKAVTGLTKDDFTVLVNGEPQPIAYFDVLAFDPLPPEAVVAGPDARKSAPPDLVQRRMTLLLFDVAHSTYVGMRKARAGAQAFIARAPRNELFAVATYSSAGIRYVVPFTSDRIVAARAVATLAPTEARDALALAISPAERAAMRAPVLLPEASAGPEQLFSDESAAAAAYVNENRMKAMPGGSSLIEAMKKEKSLRERLNGEKWTTALTQIADGLKPLEGLKQVLLFSEGSGVGSEELASFEQAATRLHRHYRAAGVVLNVIDAGGLRGPNSSGGPLAVNSGPISTKLERLDGSGPPDILYTVALDTGGQVIGNTGVTSALQRLYDSRSVTYLIGIRPPAKQRADNTIDVKVKGQPPFTEVYHRRGYGTARNDGAVNGLMLADVMMNDIRRSDVTVKLDVTAAATLDARIAIPATEVAVHAMNGSMKFDLLVYVFDAAGTIAAWTHKRIDLDAEKLKKELGSGQYVRYERFHVKPGEYAVKALVHVFGRHRVGFDRAEVRLPAGPN